MYLDVIQTYVDVGTRYYTMFFLKTKIIKRNLKYFVNIL